MRLLPEVSPLPKLFSALRIVAVSQYGPASQEFRAFAIAPEANGTQNAATSDLIREPMRFPLKMTANLTRYIAGKRIRGEKIPDGDDARAAACMQSHVHRLRAHPRVQIHHRRNADRGAMPGGHGRLRRAGGLDLRRRTDDLSRDRPARPRKFSMRGRHIISAPTACLFASGCTSFNRPRVSSGMSTSTAWSAPMTLRRARRRLPRSY